MKNVAFAFFQERPNPICLANPHSSFQTQPRAGTFLKPCSQVEVTAPVWALSDCCTCFSHSTCSALQGSYSVFSQSAALAVCWINTALAGEGVLNLFIKWINTELPRSHQSQHCPLGSQNEPALVSQGKPSGVGITSHCKADGNDSPHKRGCDYAVSKAGHMMDI